LYALPGVKEKLIVPPAGVGVCGRRGIEKLVEKYLKEAGIPNASVHTLRHTFATHTIKKGTKLEVVRQALGHESLETTSVYVHLAREMMDKELQENAL
jgi:integrase/recombinase XerD